MRLTVAYRSLSRPSSAPDAKASSLRPCSLDLVVAEAAIAPLPALAKGGCRQAHSLASLLLYLANPLSLGFARFFTRSCFATIFRQLQSSCPRIMQAPLTEVLVREIADYPFYKDLPHCFANFFCRFAFSFLLLHLFSFQGAMSDFG